MPITPTKEAGNDRVDATQWPLDGGEQRPDQDRRSFAGYDADADQRREADCARGDWRGGGEGAGLPGEVAGRGGQAAASLQRSGACGSTGEPGRKNAAGGPNPDEAGCRFSAIEAAGLWNSSREHPMDKASVGGAFLAIAGIIAGLLIEGGNLGQILQPTAALIVFGGTLGAVLLQFPLTTVVAAFRSLVHIFAAPRKQDAHLIGQLINFANKARRNGV